MSRTFVETFDKPMRGWLDYREGINAAPVEVRDGAAVTRSPWWVDFNHAPPGGGYLHILFALHTHHWPGWEEQFVPAFGANPFIDLGFPTDFRYAKITCRLKGSLQPRGASLLLLAQGKIKSSGVWVNQVLTGQPIHISPDWTEQTIELVPDQQQWTQLGSRHDRIDTYGEAPIEDLLANLNADFILVLFPLEVVPLEPQAGNLHKMRPGARPEDGGFAVDRSRLPEGEVWMDTFRIDFP